MSGIAVLAGPGADEVSVRTMLTAAPHRGRVTAVYAAEGFAAGTQGRDTEDPFVTAFTHRAGGVLAVWCGCLYRGASIVTGAEAGTLILDAYHRDGARGVQALTGSYAGAVIDEERRTVLAIRSAVGERPLFWRQDGDMLLVASEVKQVVAGPADTPEIDMDALLDEVAKPLRAGDRTSYRDISRVPPGAWIGWEAPSGEPTMHRFWNPAEMIGTARLSTADAIDGFRHYLRTAVERRLREGSGLLLSGGLDSSAVAWAAAPLHTQRYGHPLRTVTGAYPDHPDVDETEYVKLTAAALRLEPVWVFPQPRPFDDLSSAAWLHDGPEIAPMASNFRLLLAAGREHGMTTMLDGHDGDTMLGGHFQGVGHALLRRLRLVTLARALAFRRRRLGLTWPKAVRRYLVPALVDFAPALRRSRRRRSSADPPSWVTEPLRTRLSEPMGARGWEESRAEAIGMALPLAIEHLERLGLAEQVTLLHPLADPELVDFVTRVPPEILWATGAPKSIVRLACSELPRQVVAREDKTVFNSVFRAASLSEDVAALARSSPMRMPGVVWKAMETAIERSDSRFPELNLVQRILSASKFLEEVRKLSSRSGGR